MVDQLDHPANELIKPAEATNAERLANWRMLQEMARIVTAAHDPVPA